MTQQFAERVTPPLGAILHGFDLSRVMSSGDDDAIDDVVQSVYDALIEHQVVFFRDEPLAPEQHAELGRRLGALAPRHHSYHTLPDHPDVVVLDWHPGDRPDASEWHSDVTFSPTPPFASILKAIVVPPVGGDTLWASMYSVHDRLDPGFRSDLEQMLACHDPGQFRNGPYEQSGNQGITDMLVAAGSAVWPIISHHPVTGRPYVNVSESNTRWIMGTGAAESQRILSFLFDAINRPDHQVRLRWQPDTIAIWDNRATQHYAVADYPDHRRVMHRVAVGSDARLDAAHAAHQSA